MMMKRKILIGILTVTVSNVFASTDHRLSEGSSSPHMAEVRKTFSEREVQTDKTSEIEHLLRKYGISIVTRSSGEGHGQYNDSASIQENLMKCDNPELILVEALSIEPLLGKRDVATAYLLTYIGDVFKSGNIKKHRDLSFFIKSATRDVQNIDPSGIYEQFTMNDFTLPDNESIYLINKILKKINTKNSLDHTDRILNLIKCNIDFLRWLSDHITLLPEDTNYMKYEHTLKEIPAENREPAFRICKAVMDEKSLKSGSYGMMLDLFKKYDPATIQDAIENVKTTSPDLKSSDFVSAVKKKILNSASPS
jgi:hypothetical protein